MQQTPSDSADPKTSSAEQQQRARLRRNQRNSRARKQEYVHDLEQRWSECVRLGVRASEELQREARRVHEENKLLRTIIAQLGLGHDALQQRLRDLKDAPTHPAPAGKSTIPASGPLPLAEDPSLVCMPGSGSGSSLPSVPSAPGQAYPTLGPVSEAPPVFGVLDDGAMPDSLQTWDLYSWLNDLSNIHAAYGIEAQVRFDLEQDATPSNAAFADFGLLSTTRPPPRADGGQHHWPLQQPITGGGTQLLDPHLDFVLQEALVQSNSGPHPNYASYG